MTQDRDIFDLPPAERLAALQEDRNWVHKGKVDLDYADIFHVFSHSLTKMIAIVKDTKGWAPWNFCQTLDASKITPREKNEEVTIFLRLAQEELMSRKYGPDAGKELEFRRKYHTPTLNRENGRYLFFREIKPADFGGYFR
jgi:hypothetical protein